VVRFIADDMLGKLARWLRMAGVDVAYQKAISDGALIASAKAEGRILLTRDTRLIQKLTPREYLFISHNHLEDQFDEFLTHFSDTGLKFHPLTRCAECNHPLEDIAKEAVVDRVWSFVYQTQDHFTHCPACHRIYWPATHVEKINQRLRHLLPALPL
jgi:hypothetical protein